ncbi:MAG: ribbon-helix-helix domain-containing protein [Deltaproteobacteria bacterium]|nr:ribbon-helix-helix domain-containing protein [Deltaproteobacteria bacterium]
MRKITTTVHLEAPLMQALNEFSNLVKRSKNSIINEALRNYLENLDLKIAEYRALTATKDDFVDHEKVIKKIDV